jgi:putative ABC transport system permease protein
MVLLSGEHIAYIRRDLSYRGIVLDDFQDEVIDHICSAVEEEMNRGKRFSEAYREVLLKFGHTRGLRETQLQILKSENYNSVLMIKNYFRIALRNLSRHRFYSFINIAGLAIGIASCLIITLYILFETGYDKYLNNHNRIYRINSEIKFAENHLQMAVSPAPLAEALYNDFPEIEAVTRFRQRGSFMVRRNKDKFREESIVYADSAVFKVFSFPFLYGTPDQALRDPNTIVISRKLADKYFPGEDPTGQTLVLSDDWAVKVTGVIEDMPARSHLHFDILIAMETLDESRNENWLSNNFQTYFLLREGADINTVEKKFPKMIETYVGPQAAQMLGGDFTMEKFYASGNKFEFTTIPITDIHLYSDLTAEFEPNSDIAYIYLFASIAFFTLIIACINFMNLSTARSANRAKEVGIRKVLGSLRGHLMRQFLLESIMLSMVSFAIATLVAYLVLPFFNQLAGKQLSLPFDNSILIFGLLLGAIVVGLFAGVYPSLFLSAFRPVNVLKGRLSLGMKSGVIRSGLVVFQFLISIFLIIGTIAINQQLHFIQNKKIGFEKDQVIVVEQAYLMGEQLESFKNSVLQDAGIISGTISGYLPVSGTNRSENSYWPGGKQMTQENLVSVQGWRVDHDYLKTLGMQIIDGRNFSREFNDSLNIIINESAVKALNFENPIGKKIMTFQGTRDNSIDNKATITFTIIGVVQDFNFESLRQHISPLIFVLAPNPSDISFRFKTQNTTGVIDKVETTWKQMAPGEPFSYFFLDDAFGKMYSSEQRLGAIFAIFAALAIIISCLGLFALTAFTADQRTKEIGIRKVLGASAGSIVIMLSKEYGRLIVIAFVLAAPLSWFAVGWWLENYTYKVQIGALVYFLAGVAAFTIALVTMSYQSIKAANTNPAISLRSE